MFKCLRGTWVKYNKFIDEKGEVIIIYPYGMTGDKYRNLWPLNCYILLDEKSILREIVPEV